MRSVLEWFNENRLIGISGLIFSMAGLAATVLGLRVAIQQIKKTHSAVEAAQLASTATKELLQTGDLRKHLEVSAVKWEQVRDLPMLSTRSDVLSIVTEWMATYIYVVPLIRRTSHLDETARGDALERLNRSRAAMLDLEEVLSRKKYLAGRDAVTRLQRVLLDYASDVRELDARIRDSEVRTHGQSI